MVRGTVPQGASRLPRFPLLALSLLLFPPCPLHQPLLLVGRFLSHLISESSEPSEPSERISPGVSNSSAEAAVVSTARGNVGAGRMRARGKGREGNPTRRERAKRWKRDTAGLVAVRVAADPCAPPSPPRAPPPSPPWPTGTNPTTPPLAERAHLSDALWPPSRPLRAAAAPPLA